MSSADVAVAQTNNVLAQCRLQTDDLELIHACMDNYLDAVDENMRAITDYLNANLVGNSLAGLARSQQSFEEYRRENCLWYLDFSSPRSDAEQIAKNCLASMSEQRLQELQDLVNNNDETAQALQGFYEFSATRNSFQSCGSQQRYWVEGAPDAVGAIQQRYASLATDEGQLMYVIVLGATVENADAPAAHQGVLQLSNLVELRVPNESDCRLPESVTDTQTDITSDDIESAEQTGEVGDGELIEQEEPEQRLTAYFGAWLVDCIEITGRKSCQLQAALSNSDSQAQATGSDQTPMLTLNRTPALSTYIELTFPAQEIDSPSLIRWQIDGEKFGDIVDSEIRVDESGARQLLAESTFLDEELLPRMIKGDKLDISVLQSVDDEQGENYSATLLGLTKAMVFADDFVRDDG